ncbi:MAG: hypothetical protein ABEL04_12545 [Salinibacter sp.]|uniref:hypothetical protein n=1 Tax=Salinibacter sp. TaxID=2065818 RepID=UPI0035D4DFE7
MHSRVAARFRLNVALRSAEDPPINRPHSQHSWFYIVDLDAVSLDSTQTLRDGSVVLGLSATEADTDAVADVDGLGVVYYAELDDSERRDMAARIDGPHRNDG